MTVQTETAAQDAQESSDAFEAGFREQRGEPEAPSTPKTETAAPATTGTAKPAEDEWAGVPQKLKAELESLRASQSAVTNLNERFRNIEGQLGGIAGSYQEIKAALAQARTAAESKGADTPSQQQVQGASQSDAAWKQLKEDYPDWAEAIDARFASFEAKAPKPAPPVDTSALKSELTADVDKRIETRVQAAEAKGRIYAYLDVKHGDWEQTITSKEFREWEAKQSAEVKKLASSPSAKDAERMLDLYKADQEKASQQSDKDKRLNRAVTPKTVAVTTTTESADDAFDAGYRSVRPG